MKKEITITEEQFDEAWTKAMNTNVKFWEDYEKDKGTKVEYGLFREIKMRLGFQ